MGEVFRAVALGERGFEKPVVVKRILPEHATRAEIAELFIEEAKLMTRLAHPNVVEVLDFGRGERGDYFLVLELVDGVDLGKLQRSFRSRGERFPIPLALFITGQALRGLHHAHERALGEGVVLVHRDVSPSNVLLSIEGEVKIADFGVALVRRAGEHRPADGVVGKPAYMAPEQYQGSEIDARADLFAAGVVLYELLTDTLPFEGDSDDGRQDAARRGDFGRAQDLRADVPAALDRALRRALAPNPDDRFESAKAMMHALAACGAPVATSDDVAEMVRRAAAEAPKGRKVIALSAGRTDDMTGHELTRASGAAAFTLKVSGDPLPQSAPKPPTAIEVRLPAPAPNAEAPGDRGPVKRGLTMGALGAALFFASLLGVMALRSTRATHDQSPLPSPNAAPNAPPTVAPSASAPLPEPPTPPSSTIDVSPAPPAPPSSSAPPPKPTSPKVVVSAPPPQAPSPSPSPAPPPEDCKGTVRIASIGSYVVSGGPSVVQSPGVYTWRCGSYSLNAVSRADPADKKSARVTVRDGGSATVDLR